MAFSLTAQTTPSMPHKRPCHLFETEVTMTRNLHTWWSICPKASSDQALFSLDDTSCQFFATIMAFDRSNSHSFVQLTYNITTFSNRYVTFLFFLTLGPSSAQTPPFLDTIKTHGQQLVQKIVDIVKSAFCITQYRGSYHVRHAQSVFFTSKTMYKWRNYNVSHCQNDSFLNMQNCNVKTCKWHRSAEQYGNISWRICLLLR
jgi:hypothetical protein